MRIKSVTPVGKKKVYDISVNEAEHYVLENGVVTHNTGVYYSADTIFIIGRQQEKNSKGLQGWNFIINIEKSRFVKEKSKIPITVKFDGGVDRYSGLRELATEGGFIKMAGESYYRPFLDETEKQKVAIKSANDDIKREWWKAVLMHKPFIEYIENKYQLGKGAMLTYENSESNTSEVSEFPETNVIETETDENNEIREVEETQNYTESQEV